MPYRRDRGIGASLAIPQSLERNPHDAHPRTPHLSRGRDPDPRDAQAAELHRRGLPYRHRRARPARHGDLPLELSDKGVAVMKRDRMERQETMKQTTEETK